MRLQPGLVLVLFLLRTGPAAGQLRLPTHDGRGEPLVPAASLHEALCQQQIVIYLLVALLAACLVALVWLSVLFLRMQYTVERVAEAVRRTDLMAASFGKVTLDWEQREQEHHDPSRKPDVLDLDDGLPVPSKRLTSRPGPRTR